MGEVCSIDGCDRPMYGRGFCTMHWARWRRSGGQDPTHRRPTNVRTDHAGERYGRMLVLDNADDGSVVCRCDCGTVKAVALHHLRSGATKSCGCLSREEAALRKASMTHGLSYHALYRTWARMHERCENPAHQAYASYGGRGITVCARWSGPDGFPNFLADMGERPEGKTVDRIDNDGPYSPENCRWATPKEQARNRRPRAYAPPQA